MDKFIHKKIIQLEWFKNLKNIIEECGGKDLFSE